jgi:hypothetical protein
MKQITTVDIPVLKKKVNETEEQISKGKEGRATKPGKLQTVIMKPRD